MLTFFFPHRKKTLPAFCFILCLFVCFQGTHQLCSQPLAQKAMEENQLPTSTFSETLLAPSLDITHFSLGLQQLCKGVKGQSRCLGDSPKDINCNVHAGFSPTPQSQMSSDVHRPGALSNCLSLNFCQGRSWLHPYVPRCLA